MPRKGQPPPRSAARPAPPRAQPTLGQATGGRPGRVPSAPPGQAKRPAAGAAPTPRPPTAPPLGLGLGLGPRQRGAVQQAAQGGQGQQFLAARPWLQRRGDQLGPTSPQATRVQDFLATGQNQRPIRTPPNQTPGAFAPTPQPPAGPQPWDESVAPGTTPQVPGGSPQWGGGAGPDITFPYGGVPGGNMLGSMQGQLGGQYGGGGGMSKQWGGWGGADLASGYSPQMQQILQARSGMGPGGLGGGQPGGGAGYGGMMTGPGWTGGATGLGQPG